MVEIDVRMEGDMAAASNRILAYVPKSGHSSSSESIDTVGSNGSSASSQNGSALFTAQTLKSLSFSKSHATMSQSKGSIETTYWVRLKALGNFFLRGIAHLIPGCVGKSITQQNISDCLKLALTAEGLENQNDDFKGDALKQLEIIKRAGYNNAQTGINHFDTPKGFNDHLRLLLLKQRLGADVVDELKSLFRLMKENDLSYLQIVTRIKKIEAGFEKDRCKFEFEGICRALIGAEESDSGKIQWLESIKKVFPAIISLLDFGGANAGKLATVLKKAGLTAIQAFKIMQIAEKPVNKGSLDFYQERIFDDKQIIEELKIHYELDLLSPAILLEIMSAKSVIAIIKILYDNKMSLEETHTALRLLGYKEVEKEEVECAISRVKRMKFQTKEERKDAQNSCAEDEDDTAIKAMNKFNKLEAPNDLRRERTRKFLTSNEEYLGATPMDGTEDKYVSGVEVIKTGDDKKTGDGKKTVKFKEAGLDQTLTGDSAVQPRGETLVSSSSRKDSRVDGITGTTAASNQSRQLKISELIKRYSSTFSLYRLMRFIFKDNAEYSLEEITTALSARNFDADEILAARIMVSTEKPSEQKIMQELLSQQKLLKLDRIVTIITIMNAWEISLDKIVGAMLSLTFTKKVILNAIASTGLFQDDYNIITAFKSNGVTLKRLESGNWGIVTTLNKHKV